MPRAELHRVFAAADDQGQNVIMRSPVPGGSPFDGSPLHPEPTRLQHCATESPQISLQAIVLPQRSWTTGECAHVLTSATHSFWPQVCPSTRRPRLYPPTKPCLRMNTVTL